MMGSGILLPLPDETLLSIALTISKLDELNTQLWDIASAHRGFVVIVHEALVQMLLYLDRVSLRKSTYRRGIRRVGA